MNDRDHRDHERYFRQFLIATIWKLGASSLFDITIATNISAPIGVAVGGYFSFGW